MNNAKMWLVVPPAVGVPVFLGAVAVGSFAVHVAVLSNTSWVADFLSGNELGSGDKMAAAQALSANPDVAKAAYATEMPDGSRELTVVLPDGTSVKATIKPDVVAAVSTPLAITR